ncbi:hypothetical protein BVRB_005230 [Beta vulgaris subsp. vulgaris]|uniref:Uncharacterized protein n=1 Tax=Beta vulgaris subsp. vulgaris TaxID=3555 RepID=A0A0J8DY01_BETVV|nr:hypothetical protein BVRB_005230 [Beta vulgaris subsp. vulgaris]
MVDNRFPVPEFDETLKPMMQEIRNSPEQENRNGEFEVPHTE